MSRNLYRTGRATGARAAERAAALTAERTAERIAERRGGGTGALFLAMALGAGMVMTTGCAEVIDPGGDGDTAAPSDDPLLVPTDVDATTLEGLHQTIILRSCAAQPGLCHSGQFEPNLSTPALTYENLVNKPGIERDKLYRVSPGAAAESLVVHKLRNQDVLSQMPLGAEPLTEKEIAAIEKWIQDGALRRPGAEPAPKLNNPPAEPQIGVFDDQGNRLDLAGAFSVAAGSSLVLRHTVQDFETDDSKIPFAAFVLQLADGRQIQLSDVVGSEGTGLTQYEASGSPESKGDLMNFRFDWTVPTTVGVIGANGAITQESTAGMSLTAIVIYVDSGPPKESMLTFTLAPGLIQVTP